MTDFSALETAIAAYVKQNGNNAITGNGLQDILLAIVDAIGNDALNDLVADLAAEVTARQNADGALQDNIDAETTARAGADNALGDRITAIEGKIPSAATSSNQLADKAFVNAYVQALNDAVSAIHGKIPSEASDENQLADKAFVNALIAAIMEKIPSAASALNKLADKEWVTSLTTVLQSTINAVKDDVQNGYVYAGIAKPWSAPAAGKVFYIATIRGQYTNFGNIDVPDGINILRKIGNNWVSDFVFNSDALRREIEDFKAQVRDWMCSYAPIVINGDVTNAPDEVDLTAAPDNLLKFKNKSYNPAVWSGLGKKYLRKNIIPEVESVSFDGFVENVPTMETLSGTPDAVFFDRVNEVFVGLKDNVYYLAWTDDDDFVPVTTTLVYMYDGTPYRWNGTDLEVDEDIVPTLNNILTQAMISDENTIYVIRYDYDLNGATITIPENCVLKFEGGSLRNGTIVGNYTVIDSSPVQIFGDEIELTGSFTVEETYPEWFGAKGDVIKDGDGNYVSGTDDTEAIQKCMDFCEAIGGGTVKFATKEYLLTSVEMRTRVNLQGQGQGATILYAKDDGDLVNGGIIVYPINIGISVISGMTILGTDCKQNGIHIIQKDDTSYDPLVAYWGIFERRKSLQTKQTYKDALITDVYVGRCHYGIRCMSWAYRVNINNINVKNSDFGIYFDVTDSSMNECYVERCYYDGIIVTGGNNKITNIKCIWCGIKDPQYCYGIDLRSMRNQVCNVELQDNYCSGLRVKGENNSLSNILANGDCWKTIEQEEIVPTPSGNRPEVAVIEDFVPGTAECAELVLAADSTAMSNCTVTNYTLREVPKYPVLFVETMPRITEKNLLILGRNNMRMATMPFCPDPPVRTITAFDVIEEKIQRNSDGFPTGYLLNGPAISLNIPKKETSESIDMAVICEFIPKIIQSREIIYSLFGFYKLFAEPVYEHYATPEQSIVENSLHLFLGLGDNYPGSEAKDEQNRKIQGDIKLTDVDLTKPVRVYARAVNNGVVSQWRRTKESEYIPVYRLTVLWCVWYYSNKVGYVYRYSRMPISYAPGYSTTPSFYDYNNSRLGFRRGDSFIGYQLDGNDDNEIILRKLVATYDDCDHTTVAYPGYPLGGLNHEVAIDYLTLRSDIKYQEIGPTEKVPYDSRFINNGMTYYDTTRDIPLTRVRNRWFNISNILLQNVTPDDVLNREYDTEEERRTAYIEGTTNANDLPYGSTAAFTLGAAYKDELNYPYGHCIVSTIGASPNYKYQIGIPRSDGNFPGGVDELHKMVKFRTCVQDTWSDWFPKELPASGTSTERPENAPTGYMFFDTTLGKPIWWNGTEWLDITNTSDEAINT